MEISEAEWMAELDRLRNDPANEKPKNLLTDIQYEFVNYARGSEHPVAWYKLIKYFNQKFDCNLHQRTLQERYATTKAYKE
jgi:hypothetical protein